MKKTQTFLALTTAFTLFNSTASFAITASPENWWVGMQNDSLQVMLYDNNIANKTWQMVPLDFPNCGQSAMLRLLAAQIVFCFLTQEIVKEIV